MDISIELFLFELWQAVLTFVTYKLTSIYPSYFSFFPFILSALVFLSLYLLEYLYHMISVIDKLYISVYLSQNLLAHAKLIHK